MIERMSSAAWRESTLSRRGLDLGGLEAQRLSVQEICRRIRVEGDDALREFSARYDGWEPTDFRVPTGEVHSALDRISKRDRTALEFAAERIRQYHRTQSGASMTGLGDLTLITRPVRRAGLYVPGGLAAYPSTVLMTAIPARVAGVREVALATPPLPDGSLPDAILAAAAIAGVDEVYRVGGAQAIAAFAYGTASIPAVDVIAGPGNVYVTLAKREVFGSVGIDAIAGPTEILIVADSSAPPQFLAADLASQLEHDPMAFALLVTDSPDLAVRVGDEFDRLLGRLERQEIVAAANCRIIEVSDLDEAMAIANDFAPEHLELVVEDSEHWLAKVENAGAVFVGPHAAVSLGDYVVGTNHSLPTAGSARFSSPLGVHTFLKRTSIARLDAADLGHLQEACIALAKLEGLTAHANAVQVRLDSLAAHA